MSALQNKIKRKGHFLPSIHLLRHYPKGRPGWEQIGELVYSATQCGSDVLEKKKYKRVCQQLLIHTTHDLYQDVKSLACNAGDHLSWDEVKC